MGAQREGGAVVRYSIWGERGIWRRPLNPEKGWVPILLPRKFGGGAFIALRKAICRHPEEMGETGTT